MTDLHSQTRLGVILPSVNTVVEPWFSQVLPAGITLHASRMFLDNALSSEALERMDREEGMLGMKQILSCRPSSVAYCCTASSIVQGLEYDGHLNASLNQAAGVPAFTATAAIIEALQLMGIRRLSVCSPYSQTIDEAEHHFFKAAGFDILGGAYLGIQDAFDLAKPTASEIVALARKSWTPKSEACLITCLNLNSHEVIQTLEQEFSCPVLTSTQVTLWKLLRSAGRQECIEGFGALLSQY
jgi:maleate isomerase